MVLLRTRLHRGGWVLLPHSLPRGVPSPGPRKRAAVCCWSLVEGCPQGPGSLAVQAHHRGLQNGLQQPEKALLAKKPRFWQREGRLEFAEVAGDGGGISLGTHTGAAAGGAPRQLLSSWCRFTAPRKGGREPARRPALHGAKRGGAPSLGVCAS